MTERKGRLGAISYLAPIIVVLALGALSQVEPEIPTVEVDQPVIELRDRFFGAAGDEDLLWLVGKNGKIVRSEDGGQTWFVQTPPVTTNWQDIAYWDANRAVVVGNEGHGLVTDDGGQTWSPVALPVSDIAGKVFRVEIDPSGVAWAAAEVGVLMYSADRGETWQRANTAEQDVAWNDIGFLEDGTVCAVGEFGQITCRFAGESRWQELQSPVDQSLMAVDFASGGRGLAVGVNGKIIVTTDGGRSWSEISGLTERHLFDVAWDGRRWVVVGDKGVMLRGSPEAGWQVDRVSTMDYAWHTSVTPLPDGYLISGQTTGIWQNSEWRPFFRRG